MNSSLFSILLWYKNACSCCKKTVFRFSKPKNSLNLFEVKNVFDIRYSPLFKLFLFYVCEDSLWRFIVQRCFCQQILIILQCIDLFNTPGIFFWQNLLTIQMINIWRRSLLLRFHIYYKLNLKWGLCKLMSLHWIDHLYIHVSTVFCLDLDIFCWQF